MIICTSEVFSVSPFYSRVQIYLKLILYSNILLSLSLEYFLKSNVRYLRKKKGIFTYFQFLELALDNTAIHASREELSTIEFFRSRLRSYI